MGKAARSRTRSPRRAPQSAKACMALLFDSFFFVPAHAKKKRMGQMFFCFVYWLYLDFTCRGRRRRRPEKNHKETFSLIALFTDEKRGKSHQRELSTLFEISPLSPRGDRCEQSAPTVRQLLNHGYRFETLKRRLGFTTVPCQATANLAVDILAKVWVQT